MIHHACSVMIVFYGSKVMHVFVYVRDLSQSII